MQAMEKLMKAMDKAMKRLEKSLKIMETLRKHSENKDEERTANCIFISKCSKPCGLTHWHQFCAWKKRDALHVMSSVGPE